MDQCDHQIWPVTQSISPGTIAQLVAYLTADPGVTSSNSGSGTFGEIDYVIISMVILPLLLILEGHLSVTDKNMYTRTGLSLKDKTCPGIVRVG